MQRSGGERLTWKALFFVVLAAALVIVGMSSARILMERFQSPPDPMLPVIRERLAMLHPVVHRLSFHSDKRSYTINKKKIYLCLRDEHGEYYDMNMLMYVAIHELAHVLCDEIGHTPKFHDIFQDLLRQAVDEGLYDPSQPIVQDYCTY